jgi:hypothetical protein
MTSTLAPSWFGEHPAGTAGPPPERVAEILRHDLRGLSMGGFPLAAEPIVVPRTSYRGLLAATERLLRLHHTAVAELAPDQQGRMAALRADPADFPRFTSDDAFEMRHAADVARADVLISASGPQFIEFNVGAGVSGMVPFEVLRRAWLRIRAECGRPALTGGDLFARLAAWVARTCGDLRIAPSALLIGTLDDPGKTPRHFDVQSELLGGHGVPARFVELRDLLTAGPAGVREGLGVVQFSEYEARARGWDLSPLVSAMAAGLTTVPSQSARLLDSKKTLALLSEGLPWMTEADRDLVRRLVPWTRIAGDRLVRWRGEWHGLPRLLIDRQRQFVLKGAAGLSAQEVFIGATTSRERWHQIVREAIETQYYVAQEAVAPIRHPVPVMLDESGRTETILATSVVSPFCVGGVAVGCHVRFDHATKPAPLSRSSGAMLGCLLGAPHE